MQHLLVSLSGNYDIGCLMLTFKELHNAGAPVTCQTRQHVQFLPRTTSSVNIQLNNNPLLASLLQSEISCTHKDFLLVPFC